MKCTLARKLIMTCIAGLIEDGSIWMAGDSASSAGNDVKIRMHPKVFRRRQNGIEWLFGCAGTSRLSQIVQYKTELPTNKAPKGKTLCGFLVEEFVPLLQKALRENGFLAQKENVVKLDGSIMIGLNGHIFIIDEAFFVLERREKFQTMGSGKHEAFGVLYATPRLSPLERLRLALKVAALTTTDVRAPFHIIKTSTKEKQRKNK